MRITLQDRTLLSAGLLLFAACAEPRSTAPTEPFFAAKTGGGHASHPRGIISATTPLAGEPYGVAVSGAGDVLVAQVLNGTVSRFTLPGTTAVATIEFGGSGPVHVAINPSGTTAYVVEQFSGAVGVLDLASNTITTTIALTNSGFNIIVAPNGGRVYASTADGRLYVIDASSNTIVDSMTIGSAANGFAFSPDGATLYASSRDAGTITAFAAATDAALATYFVGGRPQRLAVSPDGATVYAANEDAGLSIVAVATGTVTSVNPVGSGYGLGETPDGVQLYLTEPLSGRIAILDRKSLRTKKVLTPGGQPRNVAFSANGKTGVVTDGAGNVIFIK